VELRDEWDATHAGATEATESASDEPETIPEPFEPEYEEVELQTEAKKLVVTANFTQPRPWDPLNESMRMGLVEDHIWQCDLGFANGRNIEFRIVNPLTGRAYGGTGLETGMLPVAGTATEDGAPILVPGPLNGDYVLSFNEKTLRYRFEKKAASRFGRINLMANFNGWSRNADPLHMIDNHLWQVDVDLEPRESLEFVFLADGSLEKQWGDDAADHASLPAAGTATEMAQTIKIDTALAGPHRFTFNEETGEYSVQPLTAADVEPLPAVPAPQPVAEIRRVGKN